jgi:hypothetical protein
MDKCQFCDFTHTRARVLIHMIRNHEHESKFTLSCNFCGASYNKYDSFRKHLYRKHHQTDSEELLFDNDQVEPDIILRLTENRLATTRSGKTKRARLDETPFVLVSKVNAVWIRDVIILQLYFGHPESNHVCC